MELLQSDAAAGSRRQAACQCGLSLTMRFTAAVVLL